MEVNVRLKVKGMMVEFRVANFRSFREEQVLSMVASKDDSHPENLIEGERWAY